ncbi:hypothetical protein [Micromonospora echinospora]|uniref:hypothetical protein n=1 Tax=Micromonospora echinospora TaxID=1877 RepID=UPI0011810758|nr:hypothetical protein [Micromonospora echinospora]
MIVRMLRNRNLNSLNSAKMLYRLAGIGPLSAATIHAVGYGRKELSPELLSGSRLFSPTVSRVWPRCSISS